MSQAKPKVSVVMSVYNGAGHVAEAVQSVLAQSFADFELIAINDGSTDDTANVLAGLAKKDARIKIVTQQNTGLTRALNTGLQHAAGTYIARVDADDPSHPERFAKQVQLLDANPDIVAVGTNAKLVFDGGTTKQWGWWDEAELKKLLFYRTPFPHGSAMMRKSAVDAVGGYDESFVTSQDMDLWMRLIKHGRIVMLKDVLMTRAVLADSISVKRRWRQFFDSLKARLKHNCGFAKVVAVYYAVRSFAIGFLPAGIVRCIIQLKPGKK